MGLCVSFFVVCDSDRLARPLQLLGTLRYHRHFRQLLLLLLLLLNCCCCLVAGVGVGGGVVLINSSDAHHLLFLAYNSSGASCLTLN